MKIQELRDELWLLYLEEGDVEVVINTDNKKYYFDIDKVEKLQILGLEDILNRCVVIKS